MDGCAGVVRGVFGAGGVSAPRAVARGWRIRLGGRQRAGVMHYLPGSASTCAPEAQWLLAPRFSVGNGMINHPSPVGTMLV